MFDYSTRLIKLREDNNISARKLAFALNVNPSQISKIENGHSLPSVQLIDAICTFFSISHNEFYNDYDQSLSPKPSQKINGEIQELYDIANEDDKIIVEMALKKYKKDNCLVRKA